MARVEAGVSVGAWNEALEKAACSWHENWLIALEMGDSKAFSPEVLEAAQHLVCMQEELIQALVCEYLKELRQ